MNTHINAGIYINLIKYKSKQFNKLSKFSMITTDKNNIRHFSTDQNIINQIYQIFNDRRKYLMKVAAENLLCDQRRPRSS